MAERLNAAVLKTATVVPRRPCKWRLVWMHKRGETSEDLRELRALAKR